MMIFINSLISMIKPQDRMIFNFHTNARVIKYHFQLRINYTRHRYDQFNYLLPLFLSLETTNLFFPIRYVHLLYMKFNKNNYELYELLKRETIRACYMKYNVLQ
jgi:hypothetical protein